MRGICLLAIMAWGCSAAVVDRVAVVVGKTVITESELLEEIRVTEFLNQQPLDLSPAQRHAAAERLVDQQLIRNEMQVGHYQEPPASEAGKMMEQLRQERHLDAAQFQAQLARYGITEAQLKQHLLWQLAAVRFTDQRFNLGVTPPAPAAAGEANRTAPGSSASKPEVPNSSANRTAPEGEATGSNGSNNVDQQMETWFKQARSQTRIQFKKEAFQ